jgi:hypothetical protein
MPDRPSPPEYDVAKVEAVMLEVVAELHPRHLNARNLSLSIVNEASDEREVETARLAIENLRESGLFEKRGDQIVEPTPAALRAVALLTSVK